MMFSRLCLTFSVPSHHRWQRESPSSVLYHKILFLLEANHHPLLTEVGLLKLLSNVLFWLSSGCYNKIPWTRWLKLQTSISHHSGG